MHSTFWKIGPSQPIPRMFREYAARPYLDPTMLEGSADDVGLTATLMKLHRERYGSQHLTNMI